MIERFTARDVDAIVPIHQDAFAGYLNVKLGRRYVRRFLRWFAEHPRNAIALASRDDDQINGYVVGVDMAHDHEMTKALQPHAAVGLVRRPWLVLDPMVRSKIRSRIVRIATRSAQLDVEPPALPEPVMGLIGIGVASSARGRRIGAHLMEAFQDASVARGCGSMLLSVYPHNTAARRLYEKQGWEIPPGDPFEGRALYYAKRLRE